MLNWLLPGCIINPDQTAPGRAICFLLFATTTVCPNSVLIGGYKIYFCCQFLGFANIIHLVHGIYEQVNNDETVFDYRPCI